MTSLLAGPADAVLCWQTDSKELHLWDRSDFLKRSDFLGQNLPRTEACAGLYNHTIQDIYSTSRDYTVVRALSNYILNSNSYYYFFGIFAMIMLVQNIWTHKWNRSKICSLAYSDTLSLTEHKLSCHMTVAEQFNIHRNCSTVNHNVPTKL